MVLDQPALMALLDALRSSENGDLVRQLAADGRREVLGFQVGDSEEAAFWPEFLRSLRSRGLSGVKLVISGTHASLRAAIG